MIVDPDLTFQEAIVLWRSLRETYKKRKVSRDALRLKHEHLSARVDEVTAQLTGTLQRSVGNVHMSEVLRKWSDKVGDEDVEPVSRMMSVLYESAELFEGTDGVEKLSTFSTLRRICKEASEVYWAEQRQYRADRDAGKEMEDRIITTYAHHGHAHILGLASTLSTEHMAFFVGWLSRKVERLDESRRKYLRRRYLSGDVPRPVPKPSEAEESALRKRHQAAHEAKEKYTCCICYDNLADRLLVCGHLICSGCTGCIIAAQTIPGQNEGSAKVNCPFCKQEGLVSEIRPIITLG